MRDVYAAAFRRHHRQDNNLFWIPSRLLDRVAGFRHVSRFMRFDSYADYLAMHQATGRRGGIGSRCLNAYLAMASRLGRHAVYVLPNLAATVRRAD